MTQDIAAADRNKTLFCLQARPGKWVHVSEIASAAGVRLQDAYQTLAAWAHLGCNGVECHPAQFGYFRIPAADRALNALAFEVFANIDSSAGHAAGGTNPAARR